VWPTLFEHTTASGDIAIHTYGVMILLAFGAAFTLCHTRARQAGIHPDRLLGIYLAAAAGGMIGARLLYALAVDWQATLANPLSLLSCSGLAFYGGALGGAAGVLMMGRWQQLPLWKLTDIMAAPLVLGLAIGRVGCFFAGCCHGAPSPLVDATALLPTDFLQGQLWLSGSFPFLTSEFHAGVGRLLHQPLYPTQFWSVCAGLLIVGILSWRWLHRRYDGEITAWVLMLEPTLRIVIESFRADHRGYIATWSVPADSWLHGLPGLALAGNSSGGLAESITLGITTSQGIGLLMVLGGLAIALLRFRIPMTPETPLEEEL